MGSSHIRVRFAPSPTGYLHIGGARTALFNWLFARANQGKFLLRIEDTDRERSEQKFTDDILESLTWLGLTWDEPPVYQSTRMDRYQEIANQLFSNGQAYRCDCSSAALDAERQRCRKEKRPFRYPGTCRDKSRVNEPFVLRVKVPTSGETGFQDLIRGDITFQNKDLDDWIIVRPDGSPTYNYSVVVDDHDQGLTHILRGDDHINNTPKQINLYKMLGFEPPHFAHLPMILGPDRTKLSKRHDARSTLEYRDMGYLPEALNNFLARLGWSHGDQEIFSMEELQQHFSLDHIGKANAIFTTQKLDWLNGHYMREAAASTIACYLRKYFAGQIDFANGIEPVRFEKGVAIIQGKVKTLLELIEQLRCLFGDDPSYETASLKPDTKQQMAEVLVAMEPLLCDCDFTVADLEKRVRQEAERLGLKFGPMANAIRFAVTGGKVSPGLFEMLEVQGKERVLRRIAKALAGLL